MGAIGLLQLRVPYGIVTVWLNEILQYLHFQRVWYVHSKSFCSRATLIAHATFSKVQMLLGVVHPYGEEASEEPPFRKPCRAHESEGLMAVRPPTWPSNEFYIIW